MKKKPEKQKKTIALLESAAGSNHGSSNGRYEEIARLAYSYWESRAGQGGSPEEDWFQAERELQLQESRVKQ
jgi:hypothetical protein